MIILGLRDSSFQSRGVIILSPLFHNKFVSIDSHFQTVMKIATIPGILPINLFETNNFASLPITVDHFQCPGCFIIADLAGTLKGKANQLSRVKGRTKQALASIIK